MQKQTGLYLYLLISLLLGVGTGLSGFGLGLQGAEIVSTLFLNYLSMIASPLVLLAILSSLLNMRGLEQMKGLGKKVITYTLLTTVLSALVALGFFLLLDPVSYAQKSTGSSLIAHEHTYFHFVADIIPSNIFKAFLENKVISIAFLGFLLGIAAHSLPEKARSTLRNGSSALFELFLSIAKVVGYVMPAAVWAFTALLVKEMQEQKEGVQGIWAYLAVIILANLAQGVIIIPLLLKLKGLSPWKLAKGSVKALLLAFFTKSSNTTLPMSLKVAQEELGIKPEIARFALPLCTVINMNGCAAFILTSTLFVAGTHGYVFTPVHLVFWVFMSVLAAVGNAGVPMGCFFLSSAFLTGMGVPLTTMGLILPFYMLIDMEETALNVWSDISVTALIDKDAKEADMLALLALEE